jgi:hypothetical protein
MAPNANVVPFAVMICMSMLSFTTVFSSTTQFVQQSKKIRVAG